MGTTPISVTAQPLANKPRSRAWCRRGELSRVSRPERYVFPGVALEVRAKSLAQHLDIGVQQLHVGHAADVIFSKNRGFQHDVKIRNR